MDLAALQPEFRETVEAVLHALASHESASYQFRPYSTLRTAFEQAKLWRQSRSTQEIATTCQRLRQQGAPRIAACIESVGPQYGKKVTNAVPGYSWHCYGWAVDCVLVNRDGAYDWDASARGYIVYAQVAREHGLKPGRDFGDAPHIQMYAHEPHHQQTAADIDAMLAATDPKFAALRGVQ